MTGRNVDKREGQFQSWLGLIWCFIFRVDAPGVRAAVPAAGFQKTVPQQGEPPALPQSPTILPRTARETTEKRDNLLAATDEVSVRAPTYLIASTQRPCWKCGAETAVYVLAVEPPFERRDGPEQWRAGSKLAILSYVRNLPKRVVDHVKQIAPRYFRDESQWHPKPYWMNHCDHCGSKIGDYETIESDSAPFNPRTFGTPDIKLLYVPEPLEAVAQLVKNSG